jgi:Peptidase family M1 domain
MHHEPSPCSLKSLLLKFGAAVVALGAVSIGALAADSLATYNPLLTFAPLTLPDPVNRFRAADGSPGPDYWQNSADYEIRAQIDTATKQLSASEIITYTNNSPQALSSLWIQLDQNIYRKQSRSSFASGWQRDQFTDGFILDSVEIERQGRTRQADYLVADTRMQIRLDEPLTPRGGKLRIHLVYHYIIPGKFGGRTSWATTQQGEIYDVGQWYPRMAVYDDLRGWDTLPYLGSEFYLEYGHFDYYLTVPANMVVAASGELQNPREVLTPSQLARLQQARSSDQTVMIVTADEVGTVASRPKPSGTLTWHFKMNQTRDVAFSLSNAFIWDAARIRLPNNGEALAMSFYPLESAGEAAWGRSTEYLKHATEKFSQRWASYPYPVAINVAGPVAGVEYPGIVFDGMGAKGKDLFWITAHEIGHTWFPMMVGFNERRDAWMDEGFDTFIDVYESDDFSNGIYGPKRDSEYTPGGGNPVEEIVPLLNDTEAPVMVTRADAIKEKYRHSVSYFKSALGLILLREQILGTERFDWAFRKFIRDWSYRHPTPSDFFRTMQSEGGEDLSWFWRGWYFNHWTLDVAAKGVSYVNDDYRQGARVTVANLGQLIMPVILEVHFQDGSTTRIRVPAETWVQKTEYAVNVDSQQSISSVTVDPDHVVPDSDRSNNVFKTTN